MGGNDRSNLTNPERENERMTSWGGDTWLGLLLIIGGIEKPPPSYFLQAPCRHWCSGMVDERRQPISRLPVIHSASFGISWELDESEEQKVQKIPKILWF